MWPVPAFAPVYEDVSTQHDGIVFAKVDTEAEQALAAAVNITSIPTLMAFRDGILVFRQAGAPQGLLQSLVQQVGALDMDAVRAELADKKAEPAHSRRADPHTATARPEGPDRNGRAFCCAGEQRDVGAAWWRWRE